MKPKTKNKPKSNLVIHTWRSAGTIIEDEIERCRENLQAGRLREDGTESPISLAFLDRGNHYIFLWRGGFLRVSKTTYLRAARRARSRGVPATEAWE